MRTPRAASLTNRRWPPLLLCAALVGVSGAAAAEEPTIEQIEYHPSELPPDAARGRLILTGALLTAGWYGVSVGTSFLWSDAPNARDLRLPVVGPWLALRDVGCADAESSCNTFTVVLRTALGVVSGVGQIGGIFAMTEGIFLDTAGGAARSASSTSQRTTTSGGRDRGARGFGHTWAALPVALPDGAGIEVVGRF